MKAPKPRAQTYARIVSLLTADPHLSQRELAEAIGIQQPTVSTCMSRYGIYRRCKSCGIAKVGIRHRCPTGAELEVVTGPPDGRQGSLLAAIESESGNTVTVADIGPGEARPVVVSAGEVTVHLTRAQAGLISRLLAAVPDLDRLGGALEIGATG